MEAQGWEEKSEVVKRLVVINLYYRLTACILCIRIIRTEEEGMFPRITVYIAATDPLRRHRTAGGAATARLRAK